MLLFLLMMTMIIMIIMIIIMIIVQKNPVWLTSVSGPANQSTEDAETLNLLWKPNLEIYGLQVMVEMMMKAMMMMKMLNLY